MEEERRELKRKLSYEYDVVLNVLLIRHARPIISGFQAPCVVFRLVSR